MGGNFVICPGYSSMVNFARCRCLGADVNRGKNQKPWDGKLKYDYMLWIDSDIVFTTDDFVKLIDMDKDIASGWYVTEDAFTVVIGHWLDDNAFIKNGGSMKYETVKTMNEKKENFTADYCGFGFVVIKNGVFESIDYPWFAPQLQVLNNNIQDMSSEDVSFCLEAKKKSYSIWVNPGVRVGHEKMRIL
jgi:GT2 family glycosyltransferase